MIFRPLNIFGFLAAATAGLHLYQTKHEVALLDRELRSLSRQIEETGDRTMALNAEWAWLNEPERMRDIARRHLGLEPMQPSQFVRLQEIDRRLPAAVPYTGPATLFSGAEPRPSATPVQLALLPRLAPLVGSPPPPPPVSEPSVAQRPTPALPAPLFAEAPTPAPMPAPRLGVVGTAQAQVLPREVVLPSEPALPRGLPPRSAAVRGHHAAAQRNAMPAAAAPAPKPASRPVPAAAPPALAAGPRSGPAASPAIARPVPPATQIAQAYPPAAPAGPGGAVGSVLGGRGTLPPPVPFAGAGDSAAGRR